MSPARPPEGATSLPEGQGRGPHGAGIRRRRFVAALPLLVGAAPHAFAQPAKGSVTYVEPGRIASDPLLRAALTDLDGRPASLPKRAGRPLVVNFWARWCGPCRVEIPELVALAARRDAGVDVVGINIETDAAPVRDFARAYDINYPVLMAREGPLDLMRALGNDKAGLPFTLLLDRGGAVAALRLGVMTREQLDAAVRHVTG